MEPYRMYRVQGYTHKVGKNEDCGTYMAFGPESSDRSSIESTRSTGAGYDEAFLVPL